MTITNALTVAGTALTVVLDQVLLTGVDDAAARPVNDVVAGLDFDSVADWMPRC